MLKAIVYVAPQSQWKLKQNTEPVLICVISALLPSQPLHCGRQRSWHKTMHDQTAMHPHLHLGRRDQNLPVLPSGNPVSLNIQLSTFLSRRRFKQFIPLDSSKPPLPRPPSASVELGSCIRKQSGALQTSMLTAMPHHSKGCYLWKVTQLLKPQPSCLQGLRGLRQA